MNYPHKPHAIIEITPPASSATGKIRWDSFQMPGLFKSVRVDLATNESSMAEWSFFDERFKVLDAFAGSEPVPQSVIRIFLGYGENLGKPVFKGLLAQVGRDETATTFRAFDMAFKMKLEKKAGYKNKRDDIAIIRDLVTRNKPLQFVGPAKPLKLEKHNASMQDERTDWDWMLERAHDAGMVIWVREDTVFADYPAKTGTPVITLKNRDLESPLLAGWSFDHNTPENQDARAKVVTHRGRGKGGKLVEGKSAVDTRGRESLSLKKDVSGKATKSKLSKRAQAQKELEREHAFKGRVGLLMPRNNSTRIDVRQTVEMLKVGKLMSGKYITDRVIYDFAPGTLRLDLDLYRDIAQ